jgi:hypothetical protein
MRPLAVCPQDFCSDASPGQRTPWMKRPLDKTSPVRKVPFVKRPLDKMSPFILCQHVPKSGDGQYAHILKTLMVFRKSTQTPAKYWMSVLQ